MMFQSALIRLLLPDGGSRRLRKVLAAASVAMLCLELVEPVAPLDDPGAYQSRQISEQASAGQSAHAVTPPLAEPEEVLAPTAPLTATSATSSPVMPKPRDAKKQVPVLPHTDLDLLTLPSVSPTANLQLKGIVGWPNRPMALINDQAMAPGDAWVVENHDAAQVKVRCLEIRKDQVILEMEEHQGESERYLLTFNDPVIRAR